MAASEYKVERSINIDAAPQTIYDLIVNFREWVKWSPWELLDMNLQRTFSGADSGVGAKYAWTGNRQAGKGHMEVIEAQQPSKVGVTVDFEKPFKSSSRQAFSITPQGDGSAVTWTMTGSRTFFIKIFTMIKSMDSLVGKDFEKGLAKLKKVAENPS